jgi:hypothetical protein
MSRFFTISRLLAHPENEALAAGWATLLGGIPGGTEYFRHGRKKKDLFRWATDYLPSDIQAAPAVGTIETIVTLAAIAGCDSVDVIDGFPVARSGNIQLSFREHPSFGPVANFQVFPGPKAYLE